MAWPFFSHVDFFFGVLRKFMQAVVFSGKEHIRELISFPYPK